MMRDMTKGAPLGHLFLYAVPLLLGNWLQLAYNAVDSIIAGRFIGQDALAAEGVAGPVMNLVILAISGLCIGAGVLMSEAFGAKRTDRLKETLATTLLFGALLCCGAANPRDIKAEGRDAKGIYFAVDFLTSVTKSLLDSKFEDHAYIDAKGKHVVVIGGGDTGNDCVGTSIRLGAKSVTQLEMMPKAPDQRAENNPWPEWPKICKTDYGQEEAIAVFGHDPRIYQTTVKRFIKDDKNHVRAVETIKLQSVHDPKTGRMRMEEIPGSEQILDADLVLIAAGFLGSQEYVTKAFGVNVDGRTNVATEPGKHATNVKNVFTAGDMHMGQSLVVRAIREGRDVAREVDESLMGYTNL